MTTRMTQGAPKQGIESTRHLTWTLVHIHTCETQVEVVRIFLRMEIKYKTGDAGSYHHNFMNARNEALKNHFPTGHKKIKRKPF